MLSAQAAQAVLALIGGPSHLLTGNGGSLTVVVAVVVLALAVYNGTDVGLLALRVKLYAAPGVTVRKVFGDPSKHMLEISTLFYGALLAFTLSYSPALVVLALPPVLLLHRGVLLKQLEVRPPRTRRPACSTAMGWHNLGQPRAGPRRPQQRDDSAC